jgi:2-polyprenyl-3-methyl-5-hydroxy-6-metoxy-1,4-benzoquinol methylase
MGHLNQKYDTAYFLGGVDTDTGRTYGVLGHEEFQSGEIHDRHVAEFEFTRSLVGSLREKHVLEVGFGRGDLIPFFLEAGVASYTGVDFSASAVGIAEARFKDPRVRLSRTDATDLDAERSFDLVAMYDLIEHVPVFEMEVIWEKTRHALRPGGYLVLSTPIFENPNGSDHTEQIPSVAGIHCHKQTWGT